MEPDAIQQHLMERKLNCVLLIDDDEPTNYYNQQVVESSGHANCVKTVQSGQDALAYLASTSASDPERPCPELIFLDINMPAMNGWEFLEQYRRLDEDQKSKVMIVMLTTSLFPEDRHLAGELPEVSGFENKPLTPEKLDRIIENFFENSQSQSS
jgi:CheY-like chemotaxis protein